MMDIWTLLVIDNAGELGDIGDVYIWLHPSEDSAYAALDDMVADRDLVEYSIQCHQPSWLPA